MTGEETLESIHRLTTLDGEGVKTIFIDGLEVLLIPAVLAIAFILGRRPISRWLLIYSSRHPFPAWLYREMLKKLRALGIHKRSHWTHREFLERLPILPEDKRKLIEKITDTYEKSRFGQRPILEAEKKELLNHLRKI